MPLRDASGRFVSGGGAGSKGGLFGGLFGGGLDVKVSVKTVATPQKLKREVDRGTIWSLGRAGSYIWGIARKSIKQSKEYSQPGQPPHTRKGLLKRAIRFAVEKEKGTVVVGPVASEFGDIGRLHEFGGIRKPRLGKRAQKLLNLFGFAATARIIGMSEEDLRKRMGPRKYPPRPFMGPALSLSRERLPKFWAQSVNGG
jgi:hypothetical protein